MLLAAMSEPDNETRIAKSVCRAFLDTVPPDLWTHCVLCSQIVSSSLDQFGLLNRVAPCQLLCTYRGRGVLLGFTGQAKARKWDGHAVVRWRDLLFDCATASIQREYGFELPAVIIAPCVSMHSNLKANIVAGAATLSWLRPPPDADTALPLVDPSVVAEYSALLTCNAKHALQAQRQAKN